MLGMQKFKLLVISTRISYYNRCLASQTCRAYHHQQENSLSDIEAARVWFSSFTKSSIPTKLSKTTFSRASGPGGQKTNKTSSKATTVWPLSSLFPHLPAALHVDLKKSRYFVHSTQSILIQCDTHRNQTMNEEENHNRLFQEIKNIYRMKIPGATSIEQKEKVKKLKNYEKAAKIRMKKMHSAKKSSRRLGDTYN
ncbi:peptidyl-tRNA hydrolase domain protein [Blumeria hordei DH14]|uniref:Peptidyl-tRNA hydrolase domain protein n=1 Tax=Blumeria graminis f. sp. hordei (strain DH14) TaxID=546991 RepID=N1J6L3_BLUG1|nr:peptidyl-tRNA hydrolase domain protein [Blumeria hordei DH14]